MSNTTLKISLPPEMKAEVETLVHEGHYTMSGYVQQLFREKITERKEHAKLRSLLLDAMSEESEEMTIDDLRERLLQRVNA